MFEGPRESTPAEGPKRQRNRLRSIIVSVSFHLVLLVTLLCWYNPNDTGPAQGLKQKPSNQSDASPSKSKADSLAPISSAAQVPASEMEASLKTAISQAEELPPERQLSELEKKLRRLNTIASEDSVTETTEKLANTLGLNPGPTPADRPVEGEFDTSTAQIHDVKRVRSEKGSWLYRSILVDAEGRTQEIQLPQAEGEVSYQTFQQLKQFPMADGIYRQVVMPMLQNMLAAINEAEIEARELRKQKLNQESQFNQAAPAKQQTSESHASPSTSPSQAP